MNKKGSNLLIKEDLNQKKGSKRWCWKWRWL